MLRNLNFWLVIGTWALAAVGLYAICRSDEASEQNLRAWIVPTGAKIEGDITSPMLVRIFYKNTGRKIARDVTNYKNWFDYPISLDETGTPYIDVQNVPWPKNDLCLPPDPKLGRPVYPSSNSSDFKYVFPDKDDPRIKDIKEKRRTVIIYGCLSYNAYGPASHSPYCFFLQPYRDKPIFESTFEVCPIAGASAD